ncbi:MAG: hypothetical protein EU533_04385, partial [Promethearchaeota archaeon]
MPNWYIHNKWTEKAGIDPLIANFVNTNLDYGTEWAFSENDETSEDIDEPISLKQLKFFYKKDVEKRYDNDFLYVKAYYLHHLLDFIKETRLTLDDLDVFFEHFLKRKAFPEFVDGNNKIIRFDKQLKEIRELIRKNR